MPDPESPQRRIVRPPRDEPDGTASADDRTESERHGWGDEPDEGRRGRDWYERERPPHHGG